MIRGAEHTPHPAGAASGTTIGGMRIVRLIGRGSLSHVWEAVAPDGQRVALKVFDLADDDNGDIAATFERESSIALTLVHPNIVRTLAAGRDGGSAYIAMEFVAGSDLTPYLHPGRLLDVPAVLHVGIGVACALEQAHALGVVHRDIKPANILIDAAAGAVKVADFGLARLGDVFRSRTGLLAGTPQYMAPEQFAEGEIDGRADIYALGVVLFQALGGRLPHEAASLGTLLRKVATQPAPPLSALRPDLDDHLVRLVARMLATRAAERPASAGEVARALVALAAASAVTSAEALGPKSRQGGVSA